MSISPSTIFHFTNSIKSIKGILSNCFNIKYCKESIYLENTIDTQFAIPMVSFCDIKLSQIKDHTIKYGNYGIGLTKEWAIKNNLNPVIYLNRHSNFTHDLINTIRQISKNENIEQNYKLNIIDIIRFSKNYEAPLIRENIIKNKNYRFSDEREWRFVPTLENPQDNLLAIDAYDTNWKKDMQNKKLENHKLYFTPNDVLYIILKSEKQISQIIKHMKKSEPIKYTSSDIERLTSRIITCERIFHDF